MLMKLARHIRRQPLLRYIWRTKVARAWCLVVADHAFTDRRFARMPQADGSERTYFSCHRCGAAGGHVDRPRLPA